MQEWAKYLAYGTDYSLKRPDAEVLASTSVSNIVSSGAGALKILEEYYDALNRHDIPSTLACMDDEVMVRFPDESRNWKGLTTAKQKFGQMFEKIPGFAGSLNFVPFCYFK